MAPPPSATTAPSSAPRAVPPAEAEAFRRFQQGDPAAMEFLVVVHFERLVAYACVLVHRREVAEEAAQEAFLSAWRQRTALRSAEGLRPWLFATVRRIALRSAGRSARLGEVSFDAADFPEPADAPRQRQGLLAGQARHALARALNALGETDRELVTLRFFGGLPLKEVADTLEMPMGTVGVKLGRALEKMRATFEQQGMTLEDFLP